MKDGKLDEDGWAVLTKAPAGDRSLAQTQIAQSRTKPKASKALTKALPASDPPRMKRSRSRPRDLADSVRVTEIFHSIQGESTWSGLPCTFVRLTGCPLRCIWCDTAYAFHGGSRLKVADVMSRVREIGCDLVEITGGEPLVQEGAFALAKQLLDTGHTVLVETSGALDISRLDPRVHRIMDLKCPASGEEKRNLWTNLEHLTQRDEVKFVVADLADFRWAARVIREHGLDRRIHDGTVKALLISPVWGYENMEELAQAVLNSGLPLRFMTQLHKQIWGPERAGV